MRGPRARRQTGDHGVRLRCPPRRADPGQRREQAHAAAVLHLGRHARKRRRILRQPQVPAQPFQKRSGGEHATVDRPLDLPVRPPGHGGEEPALRVRPLIARVREDEHAGSVGRLDEPRLHAARSRERGLLIDEARSQRQLARPGWVGQGPEIACRVHDLGQRGARDAEDAEQRGIPLRGTELRPRGRRGVRRESGSQAVAEKGVDRSEPSGARLDRRRDVRVVLQKPGELAGREVGIEGHPAQLGDLISPSLGFQAVQNLLRALVLPRDHRRKGPARLGVPREDRLALVVEAAGADVRILGEELCDRINDGVDDHLRVLLDPAGLGMDERFLAARLLQRRQVSVEEHRLHRRGSLVDAEQEAHQTPPIILQLRSLREKGVDTRRVTGVGSTPSIGRIITPIQLGCWKRPLVSPREGGSPWRT